MCAEDMLCEVLGFVLLHLLSLSLPVLPLQAHGQALSERSVSGHFPLTGHEESCHQEQQGEGKQ